MHFSQPMRSTLEKPGSLYPLYPADLAKDPTAPFCFLMDASMLGVGVGFDTKGAETINVMAPGSAEGLKVWDVKVYLAQK